MRIRSTKPEFWRSKTIAQLNWDVRFVLKGLESYVDDNGVGKNDIALIASDVFPRDLSARTSETLARLSEAISALSDAGLIVLYEMDGDDLLYVDKWKDIQRVDKPNRGRFRRPDGTLEYAEVVDRETYRNARGTLARTSETLAPVTGEQGNRGTGEQTTTARDFDEPPPPEPPEPEDAVVVDDPAPAYVETSTRRTPRHASSAAKTVVRQELGSAGYPRTTIDRLAVQVEKLSRDGHADPLIREALREWDKRESALPEWLPTVLGDLVKRSRAEPGNNGRPVHKMRAAANLAAELREAEAQAAEALHTPARKELT